MEKLKASDLRCGNLVLKVDGNKIHKIVPVDISILSVNKDIFKPIKLTEDWLIRFGFIKDRTELALYYYNDFEIQLPVYFKYKDSILNKIKYAHQLQNLNFALTGKELTIKTD